MRERYPKGLQALRNRNQYGDYMLQSRTASDLGDKEPMTIEYDNNYQSQNQQHELSAEEPDTSPGDDEYKEELMLIESGNFVLTAPSLATQGIRNVVEQREEPPPPDIGGLGRNRTESFEADFAGIEKTYTTFVNVAEDQIYPLELKFFLEAALEEGIEPLPKKNGARIKSSRRTMVTNHSNAPTKNIQIAAAKTTKSSKSSQNNTAKTEDKDSDSLNSESKKFRLFPNLRDVATRRTRRIEAVRQRLLDGIKREKKDKSDRTKEQKVAPTSSNSVSPTDTDPVQRQEQEQMKSSLPKEQKKSSLKTDSKPTMTVPAIESARAMSPINASLQELAEKILGKEIPKSEVSVYDFTKSKRKKKKKKKTNELNGSTSFPILSSPDMSWDSPRAMLASQDDDAVKYDSKVAAATKNDINDTVTVARGVEAVYSGGTEDDVQGLYITVEKSKEVAAPHVSAENSILRDTGAKLYSDKSPNTFALSRSFDDIYHSSIVKSIKNEINTNPIHDQPPQTDYSLAATSDPAIHQDFKWFNFGRQQKQQTVDTNENLECPVPSEPHASDERDDTPSMTEVRLALETESQAPNIESVKQSIVSLSDNVKGIVEGDQEEVHEKNLVHDSAPEGEVDLGSSVEVINGETLPKNSRRQDISEISDEYTSFNSVRLENDEDNLSVITERSEKVVSNFVTSFGKLLQLFGRKVNSVVTCEPMELNRTSIIEDLTFHDEIDEESITEENDKESPISESVQLESTINEESPSPNKMEVVIEDKELELAEVPTSKRVITMTSLASKNSSVSMASRMSSKTYDSEESETDDSDDDENITRTSTGTSEWEEGAKTHWCSCTR